MARKPSPEILRELAADADGELSKPVGIWSLEKLAVLMLYFHGFTTACKSVGGGYYVDGFAGPGLCRVRNARPLRYYAWGSPLLALRSEPRFEKCVFVELKGTNADALRSRAARFGGRAVIEQGDVNDEVPRILRDIVPSGAPCFCLFDQQGTELRWRTVAQVAATPRRRNKPEVMILFPLRMSLLRLLTTRRRLNPATIDQLNEVFGNSTWLDIYRARVAGTLSPEHARGEYLSLYSNGIRQLGYKWVISKPIVAPKAAGQRKQEMYHLVFGTDNDAGRDIMQDVFERPYVLDFPVSSQLSLFG